MPPRRAAPRQSSRKVKIESDGHPLDPETVAAVPVEDEHSPVRVRKVGEDSPVVPRIAESEESYVQIRNRDNDEQQHEDEPDIPVAIHTIREAAPNDIPLQAPEENTRDASLPPAPIEISAPPRTRGTQTARRFQTRVGIVRKSEADRKRLEQEEAEKRRRRLKESGQSQRGEINTFRGSRGSLRGRGSTGPRVTRDGQVRGDQGAGPVGSSWAFDRPSTTRARSSFAGEHILPDLSKDEKPGEKQAESVGASTEAASSTAAKGKGKAPGKSKRGTKQDELAIEEDDVDLERTNIEHINLISDDEEDPIPEHGRRTASRVSIQGSGLRPIRLEKHVHVKRAVGIAATKAKTEANTKVEGPPEHYNAVKKVEGNVIEDASDVMQVDSEGGDGPSSKGPVEIKVPSSPLEHKARPERRRRPSSKDSRIAYETVEEQQERLRYEKELRKIYRELGPAMDDAVMSTEEPASLSDQSTGLTRDDRVYLFQLPPMTPMLVRPDEPEPEAQNDAGEPLVEVSTSTSHDPTNEPKVKKEPGAENTKAFGSSASKVLTAGGGHLPGGLVGKLNVHQCGKVTLDWGGTSMVVNWGSEVDFLQDAVLAVPRGEGQEQAAYSLAQVKNKLVVTPDWQKIYE